MRPCDIERFVEQHKPGQPDPIQHRYGEHLARLRAQTKQRRLAQLFRDSADYVPDEDWDADHR